MSHPDIMAHVTFPTPLGVAAIVWHEAGLTGFHLPEDDPARLDAELARRARSTAAANVPPWVSAIVSRVQAHLGGVPQDFSDAPLDWTRVGAFQREVFHHTLAIRPGRTCGYGDIARAMGLPPGGARAVGAALGSNPWPLLVPCHRVVAATGKMTGFSGPGGVRTKTRLLALEGAELPLD